MIKVLIIEDDNTVRESLTPNFQADGYEVSKAADGEETLELPRHEAPDLVVLDIMLPELDGLMVGRLLRKESQVSITLHTARGFETDKIFGLKTGAGDYISEYSLDCHARGQLHRRLGHRPTWMNCP